MKSWFKNKKTMKQRLKASSKYYSIKFKAKIFRPNSFSLNYYKQVQMPNWKVKNSNRLSFNIFNFKINIIAVFKIWIN
jgi:hypothetical protein